MPPLERIESVQCTDGQFIKIHFMTDPEYYLNPIIGAVLVDVCHLTIGNRGYTGARRIVLASRSFLQYIHAVNQERPNAQRYACYSSLDAPAFRGWYIHMTRTESSNFAWRYFCSLRSGLKTFHEHTDQFSLPPLPAIKKPETNSTEPLDDDCVENLINALRNEVSKLYAKAEFQDKVRTKGQVIPYTSEYFEDKNKYSLENIAAAFYSHKTPQKKLIKKWISIYNNHHPETIDAELFFKQLSNGEWKERALKGCLPSQISFSNIEISLEDSLATMLAYDYPMDMELKDILENHLINRSHELFKKSKKTKLDIIKIKSHNYKRNNFYSISMILETYFSTAKDQAILLIFIMLQTGWNKETTLALDKKMFENSLSKSIDSNTTLIESSKSRSQNDPNAPYNYQKPIFASSDKSDRYSAVNLINLAVRLSSPLLNYPLDYEHKTNENINNIFLLLNPANRWATNGRKNSLLSNKAQERGIKEFLADHNIVSHNQRLTTRDDLLKRLRPTWLMLKNKEHGAPQELLQMLMGHDSKETTDTFYDSSSTATYSRKLKLSEELTKISELLRTFGFKGKLSTNLLASHTEDADEKKGLLFTDPVRDNPILLCKDSYHPDWNGHKKFVNPGSRCFFINKCLECSQCVVTKDTLPYLIDRECYIDQQERSLSAFEYSSLFGEEHKIIVHIIESWPDQGEVEAAEEYQEAHAPLLPSDLKLLIPIIIEGN